MKRIAIVLTLITAAATFAATSHRKPMPVAPSAGYCHQEYRCGPGGCGWVWVGCN